MEVNLPKIEGLVREILIELGEDPTRGGLFDTPERVAKSLAYLTSGYRMSPQEVIGRACFPQETDSMVLIKDIELYSLCEHHMLPFFGRCHIAYLPKKKVPGCSKLARIVDMYARRLQIQERLTEQIAVAVQEGAHAEGVAVMIEAHHLLHDDTRGGETEFDAGHFVSTRSIPRVCRNKAGILVAGREASILAVLVPQASDPAGTP